jgi:carboxyvinyl-carboxyphosphonate phosphorylmutase
MLATQKRERFRRILQGDKVEYTTSVFDAISARIADSLGAKVGILGGSIASAAVLAAPDLVVMTLSELTDQVRRITRAGNISLMVDADHGYGNALNSMRTVEELEGAGVSALSLEDTSLPISFRGDKHPALISKEEMVGKLKAALKARRDPSLVIIGRTSALTFVSHQETMDRIEAYAAVGADAIMLLGIKSLDQLEEARKVTGLPIVLGGTPAGLGTESELTAAGVRLVLTGHQPFFVAMKALYDAMRHLKEGGTSQELHSLIAPKELVDSVLGAEGHRQWIEEYMQ